MQSYQILEKQIVEEQHKYMSLLITGKELYLLKAIKNNIKKMQKQLFSLQKEDGII